MARLRAPWWVYLLIVSFSSFFIFLTYLQLYPLTLGFGSEEARGRGFEVVDVIPGGPAAAAGVRPGDLILSHDGHRIQSRADIMAVVPRYEPGKSVVLEIERDHQRLTLGVVPERFFAARSLTTTSQVVLVFGRLGLTFYLTIGIWLLLARATDRLVLALAVACLLGADFGWPIAPGFPAAFRGLPAPVQALFWIPLSIECALVAFVGFWFSLTFPRPFLPRRWIWALVALTLLFAPARLLATYRLIYQPGTAVPFTFLLAWPGSRIEVPVFGAAEVVCFALNYLRLQDANERRRVRLVTVGMLMALAAALSYLGPRVFFPRSVVATWMSSPPVLLLLFAIIAAAPIGVAYAVIQHRLFDIRVLIRQGLQYATARGALLAIVPAAVILLAVDVVAQGRQPLADILQQRGWFYVTVAALAIAAHAMRTRWLDALDRRFFRERYNVHQILREVAEEIRGASRLEAAAPRAVARIESALHPGFAALMVREEHGAAYCCQAIAPSGVAVPDIAADSKLMSAFRLFDKPLDITLSQGGWLQQQLPIAETEFLRQAQIDLMVPVSLAGGGREALLAVGRKKSEEPYNAEDKDLLLAIANSLALLLERPSPARAVSSGLEECPRCGGCYETGTGRCSEDDAALVPSTVPPVLSDRYRLMRRMGRGGMGTVYSVLDTALERRVALKLIREDLLASPEAAERFRREAKAAAAITHPNIVTLHDFAVDAGNRAFLVMELLSGVTVRQQLQQQGRLAPERLLDIVRGVCSALTAAHQRGLIHRDLKPENIFLVPDSGRDLPKVLDFGLAKFVAADTFATQSVDTGAGVLLGTPQYMSPEQLKGQPVSPGWDLWALAVITYEMLTGSSPFGRPTSVAALQHAILSGHFTPVPADLPHSAKWQELFLRSLHHDLSQRPGSAGEFLAACERVFATPGAPSAA